MRKITTAMQAAVVTMLVAKRPALDRLPVRWELRADGRITAELDHLATEDTAEVPKIAAELARAMRGARTDSYDIKAKDGTITRCYEVDAQPSGVRVLFCDYHRGITPDDELPNAEGGEGA